MNTVLLALASATSWGTSDFLGGITARRISPYQTVALSHALSLSGILAILFLFHIPYPGHPTLVFGMAAGFFGGSGLMLFYEALSKGVMGLTAAIAGVLSAAVPVLYGLFTAGLPKTRQVFGLVLAIAAIWMVAAAPADSERTAARRLWLGTIAGVCFGIYFVLLKLASASYAGGRGVGHGVIATALWSVAFSRITSTSVAALVCLAIFLRPRSHLATMGVWDWRTIVLAAAAGVLDSSANLLYAMASRLGRIDIAAVLSSLYPAITILLAVWLLKERTSRRQTAGMMLALGAVGLIAS